MPDRVYARLAEPSLWHALDVLRPIASRVSKVVAAQGSLSRFGALLGYE